MIHELKRYEAHPGKAEALRQRFAVTTMPICRRLGIEVVHCWTTPAEPLAFYYLTAFADDAARLAAWEAFGKDAEWKAAKAAGEVDGPLLASQSTVLLQPTDFSPAARR